MLDRNQLKTEGVRFARALQSLFKTVTMFSASHNASQTPLQTSFNLLNGLLKNSRQFTLGFVDNRVLINNILTAERTLQSLETEFLKRGIGAITFEAGMTLVAYKRAACVLCASAKDIEAQGGLVAYIEANPVEFVRVFPAGKNQHRNEAGDTIVEDSESFLMSKALSDVENPAMNRVDWFVQQAELARSGDGARSGSESGERAGSVSGLGLGNRRDALVTGSPAIASGGGPDSIAAMVGSYFSNTAANAESTPQRSYMELARAIQESRPEFVLQNFPPHRREELRKLPPEQMATEVIEDTAVKWAAERLTNSAGHADAMVVEEEVLRVLLRSIQATHTAERLGRKLADYIKDLQIPQSTCARIQGELEWVVVPQREKLRRFMSIQHYSRVEYRRLIGLVAELVKAGDIEDTDKLARHYFSMLEQPEPPESDEMGRIPELVAAVGGLDAAFWSDTATLLCSALTRWPDQQLLHQQLLNATTAVCKTLALYENFELVERIGKSIEGLAADHPAEHSGCCRGALDSLLTQNAVDRVVEIFIQRKDDHNWMRVAVNLLRRAGSPGLSRVFQYLEDESSTPARLALLRLIGRVGSGALALARERLNDSRWYVVRNACKLLSDLKDPELLIHIGPALAHPDERVQTAAVAAILETRLPNRAGVLASGLQHLHPHVMEIVIGELMFMRDPNCVSAIESLIFNHPQGAKISILCVQTLAAISGPEADNILLRILTHSSMDLATRRAAIGPLIRSKLPSTREALQLFANNPNDPLSDEARRTLAAAG